MRERAIKVGYGGWVRLGSGGGGGGDPSVFVCQIDRCIGR